MSIFKQLIKDLDNVTEKEEGLLYEAYMTDSFNHHNMADLLDFVRRGDKLSHSNHEDILLDYAIHLDIYYEVVLGDKVRFLKGLL